MRRNNTPTRGQIQVTLLSSDNTERATGGETLTKKATTPKRVGQVQLEPSPPALPHPPFKHAWFTLRDSRRLVIQTEPAGPVGNDYLHLAAPVWSLVPKTGSSEFTGE